MHGRSVLRRARRWVWLAVSVIACSTGAGAAHADEPETFAISVRLHVEHSIASRVIQRDVEDETESLWRPYGVHIEWSDAPFSDAEADGFALEATVERSALSKWTAVLGRATVGQDAVSRRSIRVSFDATERVLESRTPVRIATRRELARALGRVLAHEIGHVLLAVPYHETTGLMRANFAPNDLADPDCALYRLTPTGVTRLRDRVHLLTGTSLTFDF